MEKFRKQFEKEKGRTYWAEGCDYGSFNDEYVKWLEQRLKNCNIPLVSGSLHIDFAVYLTGHDKETIEQMYNDWRQ